MSSTGRGDLLPQTQRIPPHSLPQMVTSEATSALLFDSCILLLVRAILFYLCRRFLQATLSPALRRVSKPGQEALVPLLSSSQEDEEEYSTPLPTSPSSSRTSPRSPIGSLPFINPSQSSSSPRDIYSRQASDLNLPGQLQQQQQGGSRAPSPGPNRRAAGGEMMDRGGGSSGGTDGGGGGKNVILIHETAEEASRYAGMEGEKKKNLYGRGARSIFSICFSESCMLFILVFSSAVGLFNPRSRKIHWDLSLNLLLVLLLLVIPLVQSFLITRYRSTKESSYTSLSTGRSSGSKRKKLLLRRLAMALIPFSLSTFAFTCVPVPSSMVLSDSGLIAASLARLSVLGVLVLGGLSGFGSITTAFQFFGRMSKSHWQPISHEDIITAERSLYRTRQDLLSKREELRRRGSSGEDRSSSWRSRVFGGMLGGSDDETTSLGLEIRGLEMLETQVAKQIAAMRERKARMEFSSTWRGKAANGVGYLFAAYCICRLLFAVFNLFILPRVTSTASLSTLMSDTGNPDVVGSGSASSVHQPHSDWISFLVATALSHLPFDIDVAVWSRQISLGMVGVIIGASIQYVMRWVAKALKVGSASVGGVVLLLGLGQLMTLYLLSLLIQLRTSLPHEHDAPSSPNSPTSRAGDDNLLVSTLPSFTAFNSLFDFSYLIAATTTLVINFIDVKINRADAGAEIWRMGDV